MHWRMVPRRAQEDFAVGEVLFEVLTGQKPEHLLGTPPPEATPRPSSLGSR